MISSVLTTSWIPSSVSVLCRCPKIAFSPLQDANGLIDVRPLRVVNAPPSVAGVSLRKTVFAVALGAADPVRVGGFPLIFVPFGRALGSLSVGVCLRFASCADFNGCVFAASAS